MVVNLPTSLLACLLRQPTSPPFHWDIHQMSPVTGKQLALPKSCISDGPPHGRREEKAEAAWHPEGTGSGQNELRGAEQRENETQFTVSAQLHTSCAVRDEQLSTGLESQPNQLCSQD